MGILTKLLNKTKKVDSRHVSEPIEAQFEYSMPIKKCKERVCQGCTGIIGPTDRYTKQMGYYFHRKCYREAVKQTKSNHNL